MARPSHRRRPCGLTVHPCNHGSTASSTSTMRIRIQLWLDRLINVGHVDPYYNHGSTVSSTSTVWIHITTMARPPHQSWPCGSYMILHNHGNDTTSFVWVSQASSLPWLDSFIKVSYVETTRFITTMVATSTLSMRNKSEHLQIHRLTVSSLLAVHNLDPC
jgi:hypothetical protein